MEIIVLGERRIRVTPEGDGLEIRSGSEEHGFSPLHMLAASLATCTLAAITEWAEGAELESSDVAIELSWEYVEEPFRVGRYDMVISWPGLPPDRRVVALRVAKHCSVEHTLRASPAVQTRVV